MCNEKNNKSSECSIRTLAYISYNNYHNNIETEIWVLDSKHKNNF